MPQSRCTFKCLFCLLCILLNKSDAAVSSVLGSPSNLKAIFTLLDLKGGVGEDPQIRRGLGALILAVSLECTVSGKDEEGCCVHHKG